MFSKSGRTKASTRGSFPNKKTTENTTESVMDIRAVEISVRAHSNISVCKEESANDFGDTKTEPSVVNNPSENMLNARRKFTITLMLVVLFYLISYVPFYIIIFSGVNNLDVWLYHTTATLNGYLFIHRCYILNNVMNPIIYSMVDPLFRNEMTEMLGACSKRHK